MNESLPLPRTEDDDTAQISSSATGKPDLPVRPWMAATIVAICVGVFASLLVEENDGSWEALSKWGVLPGIAIWEGAWWALLPNVFVHLALWHLAFNVYWLWMLGTRIESAIGHAQFLTLFLAAAVVSSSFQLAMSDSTGIGASGVVYAFFGFMWATRDRYRSFQKVLDQRTANIFMIWLVGCIVVTFLGIWEVGNAAHVSGMLFGGAVAGSFVLQSRRRWMMAALGALLACSLTALVWCPWSVAWLSTKAYQAHANDHLREALELYSRIIKKDPQNTWAYRNRANVHDALDEHEQAEKDRNAAMQIDPTIELTH